METSDKFIEKKEIKLLNAEEIKSFFNDPFASVFFCYANSGIIRGIHYQREDEYNCLHVNFLISKYWHDDNIEITFEKGEQRKLSVYPGYVKIHSIGLQYGGKNLSINLNLQPESNFPLLETNYGAQIFREGSAYKPEVSCNIEDQRLDNLAKAIYGDVRKRLADCNRSE